MMEMQWEQSENLGEKHNLRMVFNNCLEVYIHVYFLLILFFKIKNYELNSQTCI
jgi:hypothetical protein